MTIILGINAFHADASAALVRDGQVVCAAEEERFTRVKHSAGFPTSAIRWCLSDANISFDSIDHIAINSSPSSHRIRKAFYTLLNRPSPGFLLDRWRNKRERGGLAKQLSSTFPDQTITAQLHFVEHHRCHLLPHSLPHLLILLLLFLLTDLVTLPALLGVLAKVVI